MFFYILFSIVSRKLEDHYEMSMHDMLGEGSFGKCVLGIFEANWRKGE